MRSFVPESPVQSTPSKKRWSVVARLSEDPETQAVAIGVAATLLLHLALFIFLPEKFGMDMSSGPHTEVAQPDTQTFDIEMVPPDPNELLTSQKPPLKFVEANPDANQDEPDKTNNFAAQNQKAAQEKAPKEAGGDRPEQEGKKDFESTQIVSGNLSEPKPPVEVPPPTPEQMQQDKPQEQAKAQTPLAGDEKYEGINPNAFGTNVGQNSTKSDDVDKKVDGAADGRAAESSPAKNKSVARQVPRERPRLDKRARPAIFADNKFGTNNIGPMAIDARWSNYGAYLQRLIEAVDMQWRKLIDSRSYPASGSVVTVKFILISDGTVKQIVEVSSGMQGQLAERWCINAITMPAPYGKWTDDMVAVLGQEQEMTFAFYYE